MTIERGPSDPWDPDREPSDEPGDGPPPEPAQPGEEPMRAPGAGQEDPDSTGQPPMQARPADSDDRDVVPCVVGPWTGADGPKTMSHVALRPGAPGLYV